MANSGQDKIHIKPSHKGLFTDQARRAGMSPSQYASKVMGNKSAYPAATVKRANFAKNAEGFSHK